jgi:hypothetical protein
MYNKLQEKEEEEMYYDPSDDRDDQSPEETAFYLAQLNTYDEQCLDIPF